MIYIAATEALARVAVAVRIDRIVIADKARVFDADLAEARK